jgi:hypothetical protein
VLSFKCCLLAKETKLGKKRSFLWPRITVGSQDCLPGKPLEGRSLTEHPDSGPGDAAPRPGSVSPLHPLRPFTIKHRHLLLLCCYGTKGTKLPGLSCNCTPESEPVPTFRKKATPALLWASWALSLSQSQMHQKGVSVQVLVRLRAQNRTNVDHAR